MELNLVGSMLTKWSVYCPDKVAIIYEEREITYSELNNRVNRAANCLLAQGIRNGDRVSLLLHVFDDYLNIRNKMSIEDIVNDNSVWIYNLLNQDQSYANP